MTTGFSSPKSSRDFRETGPSFKRNCGVMSLEKRKHENLMSNNLTRVKFSPLTDAKLTILPFALRRRSERKANARHVSGSRQPRSQGLSSFSRSKERKKRDPRNEVMIADSYHLQITPKRLWHRIVATPSNFIQTHDRHKREIKHDVYGKRQDKIFYLQKHEET